jgi:hypothetical protein
MDPGKRIEELEKQVQELTRLVRNLSGEREAREPGSEPVRPEAAAPQAARRRSRTLGDDLRRALNNFLGGESGETIESRIGGIWLIRLAVVLLMTAVVLGVRYTVYSDSFDPIVKLIILYAASACAIAYGLLLRKASDFFPQTILGTGLAGVYFTTFAAFFLEGVRVSDDQWLAIPLLLACLLLLLAICHWRRSQTVAGIALFLVYYTVVMSCMQGRSAENIYYALLTCAIMALAAVAFHAAHRWLLFTWGALIATHSTYMYFFLVKPPGLDMPDIDYFWVSNGFLALCYVAFACAGIIDAWKLREYRRGVAQMAGVNSAVFLVLTWFAVRHNYIEYEWLFRFGLAAGLFSLATLARILGPRRNYLYQIYIAKTIVMFTLGLQAYFSGEMLMVAISVECLGLAFSYQRSGIVMFKAMELGLLLIAFVGCLVHVKAPGSVDAGAFVLRSNWFCCAGSAIAFMIVAWFYEHFVRRVRPEERIVNGQRFLADTFLDVQSSSAAMMHAAAAALVLLTLTILDQGSQPALPYLLGVQGILMTMAGFVLRTPQIEVGGVLLIVASHVCYHAFLINGMPGFEIQPNYVPYTVILALVTYLGAYFWERYLRRATGGRPWEHHVVAALPYLAATYMLTTLIDRQFTGIHVVLTQNTLGVILLLVGVLTRYTGVKASGLLALGIGSVTLYSGLYVLYHAFPEAADFVFYFSLILITFVVSERLFVVLQHQERVPSKGEDLLRSLLVAVAVVFGVLGFSIYAGPERLTLIWLALAVVAVLFGVAFRESRYRWAGIALFGLAIARAFAFDLLNLSLPYQFLSFAALSIPLLVISWGYARYRRRMLGARAVPEGEEKPHLADPYADSH